MKIQLINRSVMIPKVLFEAANRREIQIIQWSQYKGQEDKQ